MARLLSGKVGVTSYAGLSTFRNQTDGFPSFLGLEEAEPNLVYLVIMNLYYLLTQMVKDFGEHHRQELVVDQHLVSLYKIKV